MTNKIQKYLLSNYPSIWNIKIVPMISILLSLHLLFGGIGYICTDTSFESTYYRSSSMDELALVYVGSILASILILIGWLIFYNRNNAFKNFYPSTSTRLYSEWLIIFIICIGIASVPLSINSGHISKWKSIASLDEAREALDIIYKAELMIAGYDTPYLYNNRFDQPIPISTAKLQKDSIDMDKFAFESTKDGFIIKGYKGPSFLFYKSNDYEYCYDKETNEYCDPNKQKHIQQHEIIKGWFRDGDTAKIISVMQDFESLLAKHNLKINLNTQQWFKKIYNPPFFPVNENTMITNYSLAGYENYEIEDVQAFPIHTEEYRYIKTPPPYLQFSELQSGYEQVLRHYQDNKDIESIALLCICIATMLSVFVFSFRISNGKQWLIAFITTGILIFIITLFTVAIAELWYSYDKELIVMIIPVFWIGLFITLLAKIIFKVRDKGNKGRSIIYINILTWLVPCIYPLFFLFVLLFDEYTDKNYLDIDMNFRLTRYMFWTNIIFVVLAMYATSILIRKWKGIADE